MTLSFRNLVSRAAVAALLLLSTACGTIQYRDVQGEFADAVAADNAWSVSPFGGNAAEGLYSGIAAQLTDEYIAGLDDRLEANAWLLRAVSEWRLGEFARARNSAAKGRATLLESQRGSRDHVMLAMLDGLVIDSDLLARFQALRAAAPAGGGDFVLAPGDYDSIFAADFPVGLDALDQGFAQATSATPPEVGWYYHYHRWRLLQNWRTTVNSLGETDRTAAKDAAEARVGLPLKNAMDRERDAIPANHPLHELILALGG